MSLFEMYAYLSPYCKYRNTNTKAASTLVMYAMCVIFYLLTFSMFFLCALSLQSYAIDRLCGYRHIIAPYAWCRKICVCGTSGSNPHIKNWGVTCTILCVWRCTKYHPSPSWRWLCVHICYYKYNKIFILIKCVVYIHLRLICFLNQHKNTLKN